MKGLAGLSQRGLLLLPSQATGDGWLGGRTIGSPSRWEV